MKKALKSERSFHDWSKFFKNDRELQDSPMRIKLLNNKYADSIYHYPVIGYRLYSQIWCHLSGSTWFYMLRDVLDSGRIPLVGITASRTWLHQGAFGTCSCLFLKISSHPAWPGYVKQHFWRNDRWHFYYVLKIWAIKSVLDWGAVLCKIPLIIISDRMPYPPSLTPLLTIGIVYMLWKIMKRSQRYWIVLVALLAIMQNINLAGFPVVYCIFLFFVIGRICGIHGPAALKRK